MIKLIFLFLIGILLSAASAFAQNTEPSGKVIEVGETMQQYIREHHLEDIEDIVHKFTSSKTFLNYLLEQGHHIDPDTINLRRRDVNVGEDIDIHVKHFTEHQNFTMLLVPVDIYPLTIYDTLLFSVVEVSNAWLKDKYYFHDITDDSVKSNLLATVNHDLLTRHMYEQVLAEQRQQSAEVEVKLHESYISTSSIFLHTSGLEKSEKKKMMESWGLLKKVFTHNLELNVEMNIYIFGYDDMRIVHYTGGDNKVEYKITPRNIFTRHHFIEE